MRASTRAPSAASLLTLRAMLFLVAALMMSGSWAGVKNERASPAYAEE